MNTRPLYLVATLATLALFPINKTIAQSVPWIGTADYTTVAQAQGDEDVVGPFDSYDFSDGGVALIQQSSGIPGSFSVGDAFTGYYQSYLISHSLGGLSVASPNLNVMGSGTGYSITIAAWFTEEVIAVDGLGNPTFMVTGGQADVYLDSTPDFNVASDTGFTDGDLLLSGEIVGGGGSFVGFLGVGFGNISVEYGNLGFYDTNVFSPETLLLTDSVFTLRINESQGGVVDQVRTGSNSVMGNTVGAFDSLFEADGNMSLVAVPLPAAFWLMGSALVGLVTIARRKTS